MYNNAYQQGEGVRSLGEKAIVIVGLGRFESIELLKRAIASGKIILVADEIVTEPERVNLLQIVENLEGRILPEIFCRPIMTGEEEEPDCLSLLKLYFAGRLAHVSSNDSQFNEKLTQTDFSNLISLCCRAPPKRMFGWIFFKRNDIIIGQ